MADDVLINKAASIERAVRRVREEYEQYEEYDGDDDIGPNQRSLMTHASFARSMKFNIEVTGRLA